MIKEYFCFISSHQRKFCEIIVFGCLILFFASCHRTMNPYSTALVYFPFGPIQNITIHISEGSVGPCEPTIDINPTNLAHVVAGSVLDNIYVSQDTGKTWSMDQIKSSFGVYGDPVIRFASDTSVLYAHLSNPENLTYRSESFLDRIVVQRSENGGVSWNNGSWSQSNTRWDHDKQWLSVTDKGNVLMGWTAFDKYGSKLPSDKSRILFSSSEDHGLSWSPAVSVSDREGDCLDDDQTTEGGYPCADVDGTYHIVWSYDEKIYLDRSEDKGKTWGVDRVVARQPGGWSFAIPGLDRCNGFPVMACDYSNGPNRGRLYISWSDQRNGANDTDVWLIYSDDKGNHWSDPVRINNDRRGKQQFFSSMDIDVETGYLYWVFYDRRKYSDTQTDVYLAWSEDGGNTIYNHCIADQPFVPSSDIFFGDYNDISVCRGMIRPIWTSYEGGKLHVKTALINRKLNTHGIAR